MPPTPDQRLDLLERLQEQQMAINDVTRQALATLNDALRTQQRTIERDSRLLDTILLRISQHDEVLARLDATLQAVKDMLPRHNGTP
jgi:hypothetical protein